MVMSTTMSLLPALQERPGLLILSPTRPCWELSGVSPSGTVFFCSVLAHFSAECIPPVAFNFPPPYSFRSDFSCLQQSQRLVFEGCCLRHGPFASLHEAVAPRSCGRAWGLHDVPIEQVTAADFTRLLLKGHDHLLQDEWGEPCTLTLSQQLSQEIAVLISKSHSGFGEDPTRHLVVPRKPFSSLWGRADFFSDLS